MIYTYHEFSITKALHVLELLNEKAAVVGDVMMTALSQSMKWFQTLQSGVTGSGGAYEKISSGVNTTSEQRKKGRGRGRDA